jgi:hypothetical protein
MKESLPEIKEPLPEMSETLPLDRETTPLVRRRAAANDAPLALGERAVETDKEAPTSCVRGSAGAAASPSYC